MEQKSKNYFRILGILLILVGVVTAGMAILSLQGYDRMDPAQLKDMEFLMENTMDQLRQTKYIAIAIGVVEILSGLVAIVFGRDEGRARLLSLCALVMIAVLVINFAIGGKMNGFGLLTFGELFAGLILPVIYLFQAIKLGQGAEDSEA